jgi:hypothetical protein
MSDAAVTFNHPWLPEIKEFRPHPLNEQVYGVEKPDDELIASIEKLGVLQPIIVDSLGRILSGNRRWTACKILAKRHPTKGFNHIPATVFSGTELEAQRILIEANKQRIKTREQRCREYQELKRIYVALAKERQLAGKKIHLSDTCHKGRASDHAAKAVGYGSGRTAERDVARIFGFKPFTVPKKKKTIADITADLTKTLSEVKKLRIDGCSKTEVRKVISALNQIGKVSTARAKQLQKVIEQREAA